jgi:hypothetical protein
MEIKDPAVTLQMQKDSALSYSAQRELRVSIGVTDTKTLSELVF